jgi:DNA-binding CsgD family transcriptional regulator
VLRSTDSAELRPVPADPDDLGELIAAARRAGVDVSCQVSGAFPESASEAAVVAVHRIVQEALVNVARHAGPVETNVSLNHLDDRVVVQIDNAAPATERSTIASSGIGIVGLLLTTFDLDQYVYDALRAGASGFLLKDTAPQQLLDAIRILAEGDALIAPTITRRLIKEFAARPDPGTQEHVLAPLTPRERDVLTEVGHGHTNAEIAERLFISPLTAKTHVSCVLAKLRARDRAQLVVIAYETGLVTPGTK